MSHGIASALPDTCVFRTRTGGIGILQITAHMSAPPGLKVRYKFLDKLPVAKQPESNTNTAEWSPVLLPGEKPDLSKIRMEVQTLMEQHKYEDSLQRQLWYFNHALEYGEIDSIRVTWGIMYWGELALKSKLPKGKAGLARNPGP